MEPGTQVLGDVMSSFPMSRKSEELMPTDAGAKTRYEFLDSHAQVIERLLPGVRAVAFFDARGNPSLPVPGAGRTAR
jgi:hypothetical protein